MNKYLPTDFPNICHTCCIWNYLPEFYIYVTVFSKSRRQNDFESSILWLSLNIMIKLLTVSVKQSGSFRDCTTTSDLPKALDKSPACPVQI